MRFNDRTFARDYDRKLSGEGYPGILYDHVARAMRSCSAVLDVGAGTGFFTIPLAREGIRVTAIEPSSAMLDVLALKITPDLKDLIAIENVQWERWQGPVAEGLICIHTLYTMKDHLAALQKMRNAAARCAVMVRAHEGRRTLSEIIRGSLCPPREAPDFPRSIADCLNTMNVPFARTLIEETKDITIIDPDREAEFYSYQLYQNHDHGDEIREVIEQSSEKKGGKLVFNALHRDYLFVF